MNKLLFSLVFAIWMPVFLFGQKAPVRVFDARTGNPVAFAHVKATEPGAKQARFFVTDFDGKINLTIEKPTIDHVNAVKRAIGTARIILGSYHHFIERKHLRQ